MEMIDIVMKLVGEINPISESRTDKIRFENLKVATKLVIDLISKIDDVGYYNKDAWEFSRKRAAEHVAEFYNKIGIIE